MAEERSPNEKLFDEAKRAAGKLCFDISVSKGSCIEQGRKLQAEIEKMVTSLGGK